MNIIRGSEYQKYKGGIASLYRKILKREPDREGLHYWQEQLDSGKQTLEEISMSIKSGIEYQSLIRVSQFKYEGFWGDSILNLLLNGNYDDSLDYANIFLKKINGDQQINELINIDPFKNLNYFRSWGNSLQEEGKYKESIEYFNIANVYGPEDSKTFFYRGKSNYKLGKYQNAKSDFKKAISYDHKDYESRKYLEIIKDSYNVSNS